MSAYPGIDYAFRPASYWVEGDLVQVLLKNVKGENRRQMILDHLQDDRLEELDDALLLEELDLGTRQRLGSIHPSFMGGEYLPGSLPGEVEIARICLRSTTSDVVSVRARPTARGTIAYRVVDEYSAEFILPIPESEGPLTLRELVRQLDEGRLDDSGFPAEGGLALGYNWMNAESGDYEGLRHFTRIGSNLYGQLCGHYERVFEDWVRECAAERDAGPVGQEGGPDV